MSAGVPVAANAIANLAFALADGIVVIDQVGKIAFCNAAAIDLFGRPATALIGQHFGVPLVAGESHEIDLVTSTGQLCTVELRVVESDWHGAPALVAAMRDITSRKVGEAQLRQRQRFVQSTLDALTAHVAIIADTGVIVACNAAWLEWEQRYPTVARGTIGENYLDYCQRLTSDAGNQLALGMHQLLRNARRLYVLEMADGPAGDAHFMVSLTRFLDGEDAYIVVAYEEITARYRTEQALRESEERYALAVAGAKDGVWDWNITAGTLYLSPRWKLMLGYDPVHQLETPEAWFSLVHPEDSAGLREAIAAHLNHATEALEYEYRIRNSNGYYLWVLCRGIAVRTPDGLPTRMAGSQTDITPRRIVEEQLLHDAFHDTLTGLPNRARLINRLRRAMERVARYPQYAFAVMFLDFDRFKNINDSLGHEAGDHVLISIAHRLERCLRPSDMVARLGGDEFVLLLDDIQGLNDAVKVAERVQAEMHQPLGYEGRELYMSVSIGIALSASGYTRPEDLLRDADIALYRAKANGRSRHEIFDRAMHARAVDLLQLETDLRRAIERDELRLHYQPIIALDRGTIIGFEALVRWSHPIRGIIPPGEFIDVAEDSGLVVPMDMWVLRQSCRQLRVWQERVPSAARVALSVNFSSRHFTDALMADRVANVLAEEGVSASRLKIEITERVIMEQVDPAMRLLRTLREMGVQLQIDDFGTGYSSLSYLHRFPINTLKIDRSFVSRIDTENDAAVIVETILALARALKMGVIAEGIETVEQLTRLRELGCRYGQGYYFSRAITGDAATELLASGVRW